MAIRIQFYLFVFFMFGMLSSCGQTPQQKAFNVFNEGVTLSLDAIDLDQHGKHTEAAVLNQKAVEKFKETLRIDSTHHGARSALGHSFYLLTEFEQAITWFESANKLDGELAINFRELGLSKINLGRIDEGHNDLARAFQLDKSQEIRSITADDLYDTGRRAFEYSQEYRKQGDTKKGEDYQEFSFIVLRLAFDIDNSRKDIAATLVELADKADQKALADKYRQ